MSYTFDPTSGATRDDLVDLVIANSFSAAKYTERVVGWLNDAVTDACRKLGVLRAVEVCGYDAAGTLAQPTQPFFQIDELWLARAGAAGSGEQVLAQYARTRLEPLRDETVAGLRGTTPSWYTTRREAVTNRYPQLRVTVLPATAPGQVIVVGLQRPAIMDQGEDVSGLGADLDDALVAYAKRRCFRMEDDVDMANFWQGEYLSALRDASWAEDDDDGPHTVDGAWGPYDC